MSTNHHTPIAFNADADDTTLNYPLAELDQAITDILDGTEAPDKVVLQDGSTLTIASGAITATGSHHLVDTEGAASTDDLDTISGVAIGQVLVLRAYHTHRTVVIKHGTGNIYTHDGNDISLDNTEKMVIMVGGQTGEVLVQSYGLTMPTSVAKGTLLVGDSSGDLDDLPVGTNGQVLLADSAETLGLKWSSAAAILPGTFEARLTLTSGDSYDTDDVTAATQLYLTPYKGNYLALYDGSSSWEYVELSSEISIKLTDTQTGTLTSGSAVVTGLTDTSQLIAGMEITGTGVPGSTTISSVDSATQITMSANATSSGTPSLTFKVPAGEVVDVFVYNDSGTAKLEFSALWTDTSTRADALADQDGVPVKSGATTRRWAGIVYTTSTAGQTQIAASGVYVVNAHNDVPHGVSIDRNNSGAYTTTATSFGDVDSTNLKPVLVTSGRPVLVSLTLMHYGNTVGQYNRFDIAIDGTREGSTYGLAQHRNDATSAYPRVLTISRIIHNLAAGPHTFAPQWMVSTGTGSIMSDASVPLSLQVVEL